MSTSFQVLSQEQIDKISAMLSNIPVERQIEGKLIQVAVTDEIVLEQTETINAGEEEEQTEAKKTIAPKEMGTEGIFDIISEQKKEVKHEENTSKADENTKKMEQKELENWLDDLLG